MLEELGREEGGKLEDEKCRSRMLQVKAKINQTGFIKGSRWIKLEY